MRIISIYLDKEIAQTFERSEGNEVKELELFIDGILVYKKEGEYEKYKL